MIDVTKTFDKDGKLTSINFTALDVSGSLVTLSKATVDELIHAYSKGLTREICLATAEVQRKVAKVDTMTANLDSAEPVFKGRSNVIKTAKRSSGFLKKFMEQKHKERLQIIQNALNRKQNTQD